MTWSIPSDQESVSEDIEEALPPKSDWHVSSSSSSGSSSSPSSGSSTPGSNEPVAVTQISPTAKTLAPPQPPQAFVTSGEDVGHREEGTPSAPPAKKCRRVDRALMMGAPRKIDRPAFLPGTEWWAAPLFTSLEFYLARMPLEPKRPFILDSVCAGMGSEAFAAKVPMPHQQCQPSRKCVRKDATCSWSPLPLQTWSLALAAAPTFIGSQVSRLVAFRPPHMIRDHLDPFSGEFVYLRYYDFWTGTPSVAWLPVAWLDRPCIWVGR